MFDKYLEVVNLISEGEDDDGYPLPPTEVKERLFCDIRSAGVQEHYESARADQLVEYVFMVDTDSYLAVQDACDKKYEYPDHVLFDGKRFNVKDVRPFRGRYSLTEIAVEALKDNG